MMVDWSSQSTTGAAAEKPEGRGKLTTSAYCLSDLKPILQPTLSNMKFFTIAYGKVREFLRIQVT